jgi:hypothetical protein
MVLVLMNSRWLNPKNSLDVCVKTDICLCWELKPIYSAHDVSHFQINYFTITVKVTWCSVTERCINLRDILSMSWPASWQTIIPCIHWKAHVCLGTMMNVNKSNFCASSCWICSCFSFWGMQYQYPYLLSGSKVCWNRHKVISFV